MASNEADLLIDWIDQQDPAGCQAIEGNGAAVCPLGRQCPVMPRDVRTFNAQQLAERTEPRAG